MALMSRKGMFDMLPTEMKRYIHQFTDAGFEPLKRLNKMFLAFERMTHRIQEVATKKRESFNLTGKQRTVQMMTPYVTSIELLQWALVELGMPRDLVCRAIADCGHLDVLQWARAQSPPCDWDTTVCYSAAKNGHLEVLQWARAQSPPCDWTSDVCSAAAGNGHLEVLQWARAQSPPCDWSSVVCSGAA